MLEALSSLIALQALDSAAAAARHRISEVPAAERALEETIAAAQRIADEAKDRVAENATARRALEKDVAAIDGRLATFEEHKSSVKTNDQFHALNSEITAAQAGKSKLEDQILTLLEEADALEATLKAAETALADRNREADSTRKTLSAEVASQEAELARLGTARETAAPLVPSAMLAQYDRLIQGRKGVAVAAMVAGTCTACHVALRQHLQQQVRRNDGIVECDSCQRILYFVAPPTDDATATASQ